LFLLCGLSYAQVESDCAFPLVETGQCVIRPDSTGDFNEDQMTVSLSSGVGDIRVRVNIGLATLDDIDHILVTYGMGETYALDNSGTNSFDFTVIDAPPPSSARNILNNFVLTLACFVLLAFQGRLSQRSFIVVSIALLALAPFVHMQEADTVYDASFRVILPRSLPVGFVVTADSGIDLYLDNEISNDLVSVGCPNVGCTRYGIRCVEGEYLSSDTEPPSCTSCSSNPDCSVEDQADECVDEYYFCDTCNDGFYEVGGVCAACGDQTYCTTSNDDVACVSTNLRFYFCNVCDAGYYAAAGVCYPCAAQVGCMTPVPTAACVNNGFYSCSECTAGYSLSNGICVAN